MNSKRKKPKIDKKLLEDYSPDQIQRVKNYMELKEKYAEDISIMMEKGQENTENFRILLDEYKNFNEMKLGKEFKILSKPKFVTNEN